MALDLYEELAALGAAFEAAGVPYALCGGLAVALYGAPRYTKDIDLLVAPERLEDAKNVVRSAGFGIAAVPMRFKETGIELHRLSKFVEKRPLTVDLLLASGALAPLLESRQRVVTERGDLWVVSREGLVSMKLAAGRPIDLEDVEKLGAT